MRRLAMTAVLLACGAGMAWGGPPRRPPRRPPPPPPRWHKPPAWGWGVGIGPWGGVLSFGTRVGRHGAFGLSLPIAPPVVRETTTVVVQPPPQQTIVVQPPAPKEAEEPPTRAPGILPAYAPKEAAAAKTWVEGHWRVTRDEDGKETKRVWVEGHWETPQPCSN